MQVRGLRALTGLAGCFGETWCVCVKALGWLGVLERLGVCVSRHWVGWVIWRDLVCVSRHWVGWVFWRDLVCVSRHWGGWVFLRDLVCVRVCARVWSLCLWWCLCVCVCVCVCVCLGDRECVYNYMYLQ